MNAKVENDFVVFTTNHFSKYIVTAEVLTKTETSITTDTTPAPNPNTGVAIVMIPAILASAVVVASAKKRK